MKMSIFPKVLAQSRILLKIVIFDHHCHVEDENVNFSKNFAQSRILLKVVIFDHRGYVQCEHLNFSNDFGPIQDFAQYCHFWAPWTCQGWKFEFFKKILVHTRILLKIVIFDHLRHVEDENFNFSNNSGPII